MKKILYGKDLKIILVGESETGKSAFIHKYTKDIFIESYNPTMVTDLGYQIFEKYGKLNRIQIWEISGKDANKTLTNIFSKDADGCIIFSDCINIKTREKSLEWKNSVNKVAKFADGGDFPFILVESKRDLLGPNIIEEYEENINNFCQNNKFIGGFLISSKSGKNVKESIEFLLNNIVDRLTEINSNKNVSTEEEMVENKEKENDKIDNINNEKDIKYNEEKEINEKNLDKKDIEEEKIMDNKRSEKEEENYSDEKKNEKEEENYTDDKKSKKNEEEDYSVDNKSEKEEEENYSDEDKGKSEEFITSSEEEIVEEEEKEENEENEINEKINLKCEAISDELLKLSIENIEENKEIEYLCKINLKELVEKNRILMIADDPEIFIKVINELIKEKKIKIKSYLEKFFIKIGIIFTSLSGETEEIEFELINKEIEGKDMIEMIVNELIILNEEENMNKLLTKRNRKMRKKPRKKKKKIKNIS